MRPASEAERRRLNDTFADLCRIESPWGRERACADHVGRELRAMGLEVEEDGAAAASGAECGNLLSRLPGPPDRPAILLCAHLDTVPLDAPVEPVVVDGAWENANEAILGADNKAALAVMLETARRVTVEGSPVAIELLFTVSEENALAGAKEFDVSRLRSAYGYVFDHATPIGEVVLASPTYYRVTADFHGASAHAGIRPEDGRNAIAAAAHAIAAMPLGRLDEETTANISAVHGGGPSTNVVPDRCRLEGETRSLDRDRVDDVVARMVDTIQDAANAAECDVDTVVARLFEGYRLRQSEPAVAVAEQALRSCGHEPRMIDSGGASDANALAVNGFRCVCLANGTEANHEPSERVTVAALEAMLDVSFALLDAAAEPDPAPAG